MPVFTVFSFENICQNICIIINYLSSFKFTLLKQFCTIPKYMKLVLNVSSFKYLLNSLLGQLRKAISRVNVNKTCKYHDKLQRTRVSFTCNSNLVLSKLLAERQHLKSLTKCSKLNYVKQIQSHYLCSFDIHVDCSLSFCITVISEKQSNIEPNNDF